MIMYTSGRVCSFTNIRENFLNQEITPEKYEIESVHLGTDTSRLIEADSSGVKSVPALVMGTTFSHQLWCWH